MIYERQVRDGEWDSIDPAYKEKGPVIAPLCCNNKDKILRDALRLFQIGMCDQPQNLGDTIAFVIYNLLGFCRAHNINVERAMMYELTRKDT